VLAMAACICYCALLNGLRLAALPLALLSAATLASFSRSGMLILFAGFALSVWADRRHFFKALLALALIGTTLLFLSSFIESETLSLVDRLTSSIDPESDGNDIRYGIWTSALEKLSVVNLLAGSYFGLVTNSASESVRDLYGIVESSPLQQTLNIGLLGTLLFYFSLLELTKLAGPSDRFSKMMILAALVQSLFYQSIEVIPFLVMLIAIVTISNAKEYDHA
jgi:hypothetical protein